jgi:hypothetical protein
MIHDSRAPFGDDDFGYAGLDGRQHEVWIVLVGLSEGAWFSASKVRTGR